MELDRPMEGLERYKLWVATYLTSSPGRSPMDSAQTSTESSSFNLACYSILVFQGSVLPLASDPEIPVLDMVIG